MKSPCKTCDRIRQDKNDSTCVNCDKRFAYVKRMALDDPCLPKPTLKTTGGDMIIKKICCDCKKKKPLGDFDENTFSPDGRSSRCKLCNTKDERDIKNREEKKKVAIKPENIEIPVELTPKKARLTPEIKASALWPDDVHLGPLVEIDVVIHPEIMAWVIDQAEKEFRTPELQINYILNKYMNQHQAEYQPVQKAAN